MTEPNPYDAAPMQIPASHPMLDATGFEDVAAQAVPHRPLGASPEVLAAVGMADWVNRLPPDYPAALAVEAEAQRQLAEVRALGEAGYSSQEVAAALEVLAKAGIGVPTSPSLAQFSIAPGARRRDVTHRCHRCNAPATAQWQRQATAEEAETWHAGREQWIRQHNDGRPEAEYVADRTDVPTMAVHGCGEHGDPCPGRVHDAECQGVGHCRCVVESDNPVPLQELTEQHRAAEQAYQAARAERDGES